MSELFFPVVGALIVFFVAVPLLTLASRGIVTALPTPRDRMTAQESPWRLLLIVGPTLGPLIWLISASIHQSEAGAALAACVVDHLGGELCGDVVLFGLILLSVLGYGVLRRARRGCDQAPAGPELSDAEAAIARVRDACRRSRSLCRFAPRVRVVRGGGAPACTRGVLRSRIELEAGLVMRLDDDELEATLLHEAEHAHAWDPCCFFVAQVALSINPLGRLLASELARYHFAREALCDKRAVQRGADPLALARSIVCVAAPASAADAPVVPALGGHGIGGVRLRVQLLLGYAARPPGPVRRQAPVGTLTALVTLLALWPHVMGAGALDVFHRSIERAALIFGLG
jgi:Zn-dependent protease with chaperone function